MSIAYSLDGHVYAVACHIYAQHVHPLSTPIVLTTVIFCVYLLGHQPTRCFKLRTLQFWRVYAFQSLDFNKSCKPRLQTCDVWKISQSLVGQLIDLVEHCELLSINSWKATRFGPKEDNQLEALCGLPQACKVLYVILWHFLTEALEWAIWIIFYTS